MSLIAVSCETPIYQERSCLVYVRNTCSIWYLILFVRIAIFMSLHGPAGACIPVASTSPIHVFPIQCVLKHRGAHKHIYIYICDLSREKGPYAIFSRNAFYYAFL